MPQPFIHLRAQSALSLAEGAIHTKRLAELAAEDGMPALAIADRNNLFGALEFSEALWAAGVQPIIGVTLAITPPLEGEEMAHARAPAPDWLVLHAQSEAGYEILLKLVSKAHLETDSTHAPQVTLEDVERHAADIIALSGGMDGAIGKARLNGNPAKAEAYAQRLVAAFGDRFYMELSRHGRPEEEALEAPAVELAQQLGIPLVATNRCLFEKTSHYDAHDALTCIAAGIAAARKDRPKLTPEYRFRSMREMQALFEDLPEALENTVNIARRCAFKVQK
ncbi:MAG: PHP domain-containing protein, partial [Sphingomonadales bacterium]